MAKLIRPYKISANTWDTSKTIPPYTDENGRIIDTIEIGESFDGPVTEKVNEEIYRDIVTKKIFDEDGNRKEDCKIALALGQVPQMIITSGGTLVLHNPNIIKAKQKVEEVLKEMPEQDIYHTFKEIRLNKLMLAKKGNYISNFMNALNQNGVSYNYELVAAVLSNYICDEARESENEVQEEIKYMTYEELLELSLDLQYLEHFQETENEQLLEYLKICKRRDISFYVRTELFYRFVSGQVKGKD